MRIRKYLIDTHVWIWWFVFPQRLSDKTARLIEDVSQYDEILLSAISIRELGLLIRKGRVVLKPSGPKEWVSAFLQMDKLRVIPVTAQIAYLSTTLPGSFHKDPADQILVASAMEEDAVIITKDMHIREYRHVRSVW